MIRRELNAVVLELALRPSLLARGGTLGFEQLELAAVAGVAQRGAAARAARPRRRFAREGAEARVVELARRRVETAREPADPEQAPAAGAARTVEARRPLELRVVRRPRQLE